MKQKTIFFAVAIMLMAQTVFATKNNPNELAFIEAFRHSNMTEMENILRQKSFQMDLSALLETVFQNFRLADDNGKTSYRGPLNTDKKLLVPTFQLLIKYGADVNYNVSYYYWLELESHNFFVWYEKLQQTDLPRIYIEDVKKEFSLLSNIVTSASTTYKNPQIRLQLARLLLEAGADPNNIDWLYITENAVGWFGDNQIALARLFIEHGLNVNRPIYGDGKTYEIYPLISMAGSGQIGCVRLLVESGAKVNQISFNSYIEKQTAAQYAYGKGEMDIYNYLKQHGATWSPPVQVANTPPPSQPTPQVAAPPSSSSRPRQTYDDSYDYSPPPSSSRGSSSSSSGSSSSGSSWAEAFKSPLDSGTYSAVGTNIKMSFSAIGKTGLITYTNRDGKTGIGNYSINGNSMTVQMEGYTFVYTITSKTSFSGHGESWVRTGY